MLALALALLLSRVGAQCHQHGSLDAATSTCNCTGGFGGVDCSLRTCPLGPAWIGRALTDDNAHALAECSNAGLCDSATGQCACAGGRTGAACAFCESAARRHG